MLAVHAPPASLSRPAARGSPGGPRRASPSVAFGGANVRFPARSPAVRFATRRTRASGADDARPETRHPGKEDVVRSSPGSETRARAEKAPVLPNRAFARFVFTAALSMFAFGLATGSVASALVFLEDASSAAALTTSAKARLVAATPLGAVLGALAAPRAADTRGRKRTLLDVAGAAYALGGALCCFAPTDPSLLPAFLLLGRALLGVGAGVSTSVTTMYVSECAPARVRGSAASVCPLFGAAGVVAAYLVGAVLAALVDAAAASPETAWRCALGSCLAPVLAQAAMRDCLVESPRWLLARRGPSEARAAARRLGGTVEAELFLSDVSRNRPSANPSIGREEPTSSEGASSSVATPNDVKNKNVTLLDLFATETNRAATFVAVSLNAAQQFCGINVVVYFFPRVLAGDFGFTKTTAMAVAAAVSVVQVAFGALLARLRVVDRFGRKPSALCGVAGLIFGLACLAFGAHKRLPLLAVAGVAAFRLGFAASLGPLPYVVAAEVYSSSATRATGVSLATATQWACNALVSGTYLPLESSLGPTRVWLVYLAACVVTFVAVARFAPETKDARLE